MLNVDGWTDGRTYERMNVRTDERTNGRKLARLCLPAKAGATKREAEVFLFLKENTLWPQYMFLMEKNGTFPLDCPCYTSS